MKQFILTTAFLLSSPYLLAESTCKDVFSTQQSGFEMDDLDGDGVEETVIVTDKNGSAVGKLALDGLKSELQKALDSQSAGFKKVVTNFELRQVMIIREKSFLFEVRYELNNQIGWLTYTIIIGEKPDESGIPLGQVISPLPSVSVPTRTPNLTGVQFDTDDDGKLDTIEFKNATADSSSLGRAYSLAEVEKSVLAAVGSEIYDQSSDTLEIIAIQAGTLENIQLKVELVKADKSKRYVLFVTFEGSKITTILLRL